MIESFSVRFGAMASQCSVRLAARDQAHAAQLAQSALDEVARIEAKYSRYRTDSVVARINGAAGRAAVAVDAETAALLAYADTLFQTSAGKFDLTSGVLRRAWDFRQKRLPNAEHLAALRAMIGWDRVERSADTIRLPAAGMEIDFGGIGKEYAADRAASLLAAQGVRHGYVNLGGDLRVIGPQPDGSAWQVGIQDPRGADGITVANIGVETGALASSGDYERFIEVDGKRYCHVLDPHTGYPVSYWRSVSVLAPVAIAAGSYATVAMLKEAEGLEFLEASGLAFLAIDHAGVVHRSS